MKLEHVISLPDQRRGHVCCYALGTLIVEMGNDEGSGMPTARTRVSNQPTAIADTENGSAAQRERRKRILDATLALASKGGYDAVQMRAVAERADVALGTLYRYFPSKIHLLVSALVLEFERTQEKLDRRPIPGD